MPWQPVAVGARAELPALTMRNRHNAVKLDRWPSAVMQAGIQRVCHHPVNWRPINEQIITEFRANVGVVGGHIDGKHLLLLHTIGRRTGQERVIPPVYTPRPLACSRRSSVTAVLIRAAAARIADRCTHHRGGYCPLCVTTSRAGPEPAQGII